MTTRAQLNILSLLFNLCSVYRKITYCLRQANIFQQNVKQTQHKEDWLSRVAQVSYAYREIRTFLRVRRKTPVVPIKDLYPNKHKSVDTGKSGFRLALRYSILLGLGLPLAKGKALETWIHLYQTRKNDNLRPAPSCSYYHIYWGMKGQRLS